MVSVITATEASKNFSSVIHRAHYDGKVIIQKNGKPFVFVARIREPLTGAEIIELRKRMPPARLTPKEAAHLADNIEAVRREMNGPPVNKWE